MPTATITSKGQVTIPLSVRDRLGLKSGDQIDFVLESKGRVTLKSTRVPFETLRGILKNTRRKPVSVRQMDQAIERTVREKWLAAQRRSK